MKRFVCILSIVLMSGSMCMGQHILSINKDVHNDSGTVVHGIKIKLGGQPVVLQHYDGFTNKNHFGSFTTAVVDGDTVLWWSEPLGSNGQYRPIPHCEWVHVGYRLDRPADILATYWTDENGDHVRDINQPGQEVTLTSDGRLKLKVSNTLEAGVPISFTIAGYAFVGQGIPLAELNGDNPIFNTLTPVGGTVNLPPGAVKSTIVPSDPDKPWFIYVKEGKVGDTVVFRDYGQFGPPIGGPIPTVSQWGLIILAVLVVLGGVIAIRRRQQIA